MEDNNVVNKDGENPYVKCLQFLCGDKASKAKSELETKGFSFITCSDTRVDIKHQNSDSIKIVEIQPENREVVEFCRALCDNENVLEYLTTNNISIRKDVMEFFSILIKNKYISLVYTKCILEHIDKIIKELSQIPITDDKKKKLKQDLEIIKQKLSEYEQDINNNIDINQNSQINQNVNNINLNSSGISNQLDFSLNTRNNSNNDTISYEVIKKPQDPPYITVGFINTDNNFNTVTDKTLYKFNINGMSITRDPNTKEYYVYFRDDFFDLFREQCQNLCIDHTIVNEWINKKFLTSPKLKRTVVPLQSLYNDQVDNDTKQFQYILLSLIQQLLTDDQTLAMKFLSGQRQDIYKEIYKQVLKPMQQHISKLESENIFIQPSNISQLNNLNNQTNNIIDSNSELNDPVVNNNINNPNNTENIEVNKEEEINKENNIVSNNIEPNNKNNIQINNNENELKVEGLLEKDNMKYYQITGYNHSSGESKKLFHFYISPNKTCILREYKVVFDYEDKNFFALGKNQLMHILNIKDDKKLLKTLENLGVQQANQQLLESKIDFDLNSLNLNSKENIDVMEKIFNYLDNDEIKSDFNKYIELLIEKGVIENNKKDEIVNSYKETLKNLETRISESKKKLSIGEYTNQLIPNNSIQEKKKNEKDSGNKVSAHGFDTAMEDNIINYDTKDKNEEKEELDEKKEEESDDNNSEKLNKSFESEKDGNKKENNEENVCQVPINDELIEWIVVKDDIKKSKRPYDRSYWLYVEGTRNQQLIFKFVHNGENNYSVDFGAKNNENIQFNNIKWNTGIDLVMNIDIKHKDNKDLLQKCAYDICDMLNNIQMIKNIIYNWKNEKDSSFNYNSNIISGVKKALEKKCPKIIINNDGNYCINIAKEEIPLFKIDDSKIYFQKKDLELALNGEFNIQDSNENFEKLKQCYYDLKTFLKIINTNGQREKEFENIGQKIQYLMYNLENIIHNKEFLIIDQEKVKIIKDNYNKGKIKNKEKDGIFFEKTKILYKDIGSNGNRANEGRIITLYPTQTGKFNNGLFKIECENGNKLFGKIAEDSNKFRCETQLGIYPDKGTMLFVGRNGDTLRYYYNLEQSPSLDEVVFELNGNEITLNNMKSNDTESAKLKEKIAEILKDNKRHLTHKAMDDDDLKKCTKTLMKDIKKYDIPYDYDISINTNTKKITKNNNNNINDNINNEDNVVYNSISFGEGEDRKIIDDIYIIVSEKEIGEYLKYYKDIDMSAMTTIEPICGIINRFIDNFFDICDHYGLEMSNEKKYAYVANLLLKHYTQPLNEKNNLTEMENKIFGASKKDLQRISEYLKSPEIMISNIKMACKLHYDLSKQKGKNKQEKVDMFKDFEKKEESQKNSKEDKNNGEEENKKSQKEEKNQKSEINNKDLKDKMSKFSDDFDKMSIASNQNDINIEKK